MTTLMSPVDGHPISGADETFSLPEFVQSLFHSKKTGTILVNTSKKRGEIIMRDGNITLAYVEGSDSEDAKAACLKILCWEDVRFEFRRLKCRSFSQEITEDTVSLLLRAAQIADESKL